MKFSAIATVYNEETSIKDFLKSIAKQTRKPDELIIVDGGSKDRTVEIIKEFSKKHKWVKIFVKKGCNIAEGRNEAIRRAKNRIIVGVDAGCKMDKNNFKNITEPFKDNCDVVSGNWVADYDNIKQEAMARVVQPDLDKPFNKRRFLPSSRNIAFKKECWKKVGGYPEHLYTGEDTLFNLKLKKAGCKFCLAKNAVVYWKMRKNYRKFWRQFYLYGKGDKQAGNLLDFRLNNLLNFLMVLGFWMWILCMVIAQIFSIGYAVAVFALMPLYFLSSGVKMFLKTGKVSLMFHGAWAMAIKRIAYVMGATFGRGKGKKVY